MNVVFYLLVLIPVLVAGFNRVPTYQAVLNAETASIPAAGLAAGTAVLVTTGEGAPDGMRTYDGTIERVDKSTATVRSHAPNGPMTVRVPGAEAMAVVGQGALDGAKAAVELALSLVGTMTLFLGLMKVVDTAGGLKAMARWIRPVMVKLFPDVPSEHPAMSAMIMNLAANVLGLGNAATPFGIKAMQELETLNPTPGTATNAMVLFLAINTAGVAVLPTGVIAIRAALGSSDPAAILLPTLAGTVLHTIAAVIICKSLQRFFPLAVTAPIDPNPRPATPIGLGEFAPMLSVLAAFGAFVWAAHQYGAAVTSWIIPGLILGMLSVGVMMRVKVYEVFIEGAKDGFATAMRIVPFVVAILAGVGMFQASGAMGRLVTLVAPVCRLIGLPPEVLPLALLRPLSGSGAIALTAELTRVYDPDTFIGQVAGTVNGSSETTFYVLALYFGSIGIHRSRHAVLTGVLTDIAGVIFAVTAVRILLGGG
ncbi:MAG: spore maturation protein [Myxococcales bacterium]|nr:spore maturation protein [Myxococcales bacterium]